MNADRCLLCLSSCNEYQSLLDVESGQHNEVYNTSIKYFNPLFLQADDGDQTSLIICIECWDQIRDFHTFHEWITNTQLQLRNQTPREELVIKSETKSEGDAEELPPPLPVCCIYPQQAEITSTSADLNKTNDLQDDDDKKSLSYLKKELFPCSICGRSFRTSNTLYAHKNRNHIEQRNICTCKKSKEFLLEIENGDAPSTSQRDIYKFECCPLKRNMLKNDKLIATWKKQLECSVCKQTFPYYSYLRLHFKYDHPGVKFFIMCCKRKLQQLPVTLEHISLHLNPNLFQCDFCHLKYSAKSSLMNHTCRMRPKSGTMKRKLKKEKTSRKCIQTYALREICE